eukprot:g2746.t1
MDEQVLASVVETLTLANTPSNEAQRQVAERFQQLNQHPDLLLYLIYVFQDKAREEQLRQRAGLVLKQFFRSRDISTLNPQHIRTVRDQLVETVRDPSRTSGNVLTFIIQKTHLPNNFDAIGILTTGLRVGTSSATSSTNPNPSDFERLDGSFSCLSKICEDACDAMKTFVKEQQGGVAGFTAAPMGGVPDVELPDQQKQFLQFCSEKLLPTAIDYGRMEAPKVCRKYAIELVNHFVLNDFLERSPFGDMLGHLLGSYFQMIERLAADDEADVLVGVVKGMSHLLNSERGYNLVGEKAASTVLEFMLRHSHHANEKIRIEACDFWSQAIRWNAYYEAIKPILPQLVPVLLTNMKYAEADYLNMYDRDDDVSAKDHAQDIEPRFHDSRNQHADDDPEKPEQTNAWGSEWTVRKAAANSLDHLANYYGADVMNLVLPIISQNLQSNDWETQESAVLAIGAIGVGCFELMCSHLPQVFELLITKTSGHDKPLLRSISCWCMSRYGYWVCENPNVCREVIKSLLLRILDRSKRVQEAACSAFATLCESTQEPFSDFIPDVLPTFARAFDTYQTKNLFVLYDAVGAFVRNVRWNIKEEASLNVLIPPIMKKFDELQPRDKLTIACFECLMALVENLGSACSMFSPIALKVIERCGQIIADTLQQEVVFSENPNNAERPERDIIATALDLLSGIVDGFGGDVGQLLEQKNFVQVLPTILCANGNRGYHFGAQQCAFALMGECAKFCPRYLKPFLPQLLPACAANLVHPNHAVSNNAGWAVGEVALQVDAATMKPFAGEITTQLVNSIGHSGSYPTTPNGVDHPHQPPGSNPYAVNACITLGRLACVSPEDMVGQFGSFAQAFLVLMRDARVDHEKTRAFMGFCNLIKLNPEVLLMQQELLLVLFLLNVDSFQGKEGTELKTRFREVLQGYRGKLGSAAWDNLVFRLQPPDLAARITADYIDCTKPP